MQKLKRHLVEKTLGEMGLKIFTANDLVQIFGANKRASQAFLSYNTQNGFLVKLRQGYYSLSSYPPSDFLIANKIYFPSYVSLDTALSFHGLIPETIYNITSVTTRKSSQFVIGGREFVYHKIKTSAFTGYRPERVNGEIVQLASPEKAVADFWYFVYLRKRQPYERLSVRGTDQHQIKEYLNLLGGPRLVAFVAKTHQP